MRYAVDGAGVGADWEDASGSTVAASAGSPTRILAVYSIGVGGRGESNVCRIVGWDESSASYVACVLSDVTWNERGVAFVVCCGTAKICWTYVAKIYRIGVVKIDWTDVAKIYWTGVRRDRPADAHPLDGGWASSPQPVRPDVWHLEIWTAVNTQENFQGNTSIKHVNKRCSR